MTRGATFAYNLRFPGQYFDSETGTHFNWMRDYDPRIGRYIESDPIGLRGGLDTYSYVRAQPLTNTDPRGLASISVDVNGHGFIGVLGAKGGFGIAFGNNICIKVESCGRAGLGAAAQINASLGYSAGDLCTQVVEATGVFVAGGPFLGGLSSVKGSGSLSASFGGGLGGAIAAGIEACQTQYYCLIKKPCNSCPAPPPSGGMSDVTAP